MYRTLLTFCLFFSTLALGSHQPLRSPRFDEAALEQLMAELKGTTAEEQYDALDFVNVFVCTDASDDCVVEYQGGFFQALMGDKISISPELGGVLREIAAWTWDPSFENEDAGIAKRYKMPHFPGGPGGPPKDIPWVDPVGGFEVGNGHTTN